MSETGSIKRSELYERVWKEPIIRIASELGTTNFLISELCRQHDIPTPPAGHWTKVQLGKPIEIKPLPDGDDVEISLARLARPGFRPSKPVSRSERREARKEADSATVEFERHPKVQKSIEALQQGKPGQPRTSKGKGRFNVSISDELIDRVEALLSNLVHELERRGGVVAQGEHGLALRSGDHEVGLSVTEKLHRIPHQLTADERDAQARYEAKRAAAKDPWSFSLRYDAPKIPAHDYLPTGKLSVTLDDKVGYRGIRRTFSDRVALKAEMMVVEIVDAVEGYSRAQDEWLEERRWQELEAQEQARLATLERKRQALEVRRLEFVDRQVARLDRALSIERLLSALPPEGKGSEYRAFREWAEMYARGLREELAPNVIDAKLVTTNLMREGAELADWLDVETGRWQARRH